MRYYIAGHDNRGTDEAPFGRIYLAAKRNGDIVGCIGYGPHDDDSDPYAVWPTRDDPMLGRDPLLRERARHYLRMLYPQAGNPLQRRSDI